MDVRESKKLETTSLVKVKEVEEEGLEVRVKNVVMFEKFRENCVYAKERRESDYMQRELTMRSVHKLFARTLAPKIK